MLCLQFTYVYPSHLVSLAISSSVMSEDNCGFVPFYNKYQSITFLGVPYDPIYSDALYDQIV